MMLIAFLLWLAYIIWAFYEDSELEKKSQQPLKKPVLTPKEIEERYWRKNYSPEANKKEKEKPFLEGAVEPTDGSACESDCKDCK